MEKFIIDTEDYAGNFERKLCAFITGVVGDCGVGSNFTGNFAEIQGVVQEPDDHGVFRPCSIYPTPGYYNNGLGFAFQSGQESEALEKYKEYVRAEEEKWMKIEEGHRGKNVLNWTDEAIDRSLERRRKKLEEVESMTEVNKYPSYQSVVIFFEDGTLTPELIKELKKRCEIFAKEEWIDFSKTKRLRILGYRKETEKVEVSTETIEL